MKKIRTKARAIIVEWIKEVIKKEDHTKVNRENLEKLIENSSYYWSVFELMVVWTIFC